MDARDLSRTYSDQPGRSRQMKAKHLIGSQQYGEGSHCGLQARPTKSLLCNHITSDQQTLVFWNIGKRRLRLRAHIYTLQPLKQQKFLNLSIARAGTGRNPITVLNSTNAISAAMHAHENDTNFGSLGLPSGPILFFANRSSVYILRASSNPTPLPRMILRTSLFAC